MCFGPLTLNPLFRRVQGPWEQGLDPLPIYVVFVPLCFGNFVFTTVIRLSQALLGRCIALLGTKCVYSFSLRTLCSVGQGFLKIQGVMANKVKPVCA